MRVWVERPSVVAETVVFRWRQSEENPFQQVNEFSFRYEGLNLAAFSRELFIEVFLGLQLGVLTAYRKPVAVTFADAVPRASADYWTIYHRAELVTIDPLAGVDEYSPWAITTSPSDSGPANAVFFGGGKDSTLAACLLAETYGAEEVLLVQFVDPMRVNPSLTARIARRQESLMLRPAREGLGVKTQRVWTD
jgi:hypothetical protein